MRQMPSMTFVMVNGMYPFAKKRKELTRVPIELGILVWQDFMFGCGQVIERHSTGSHRVLNPSSTLHTIRSRSRWS